ncbi:MAG: peptidylprolyl isomerase, partial [Burkholderiales bacterium]|nr:peptidylprolyl isomerase [Burkholderiales bacterium]
MSIPAIPVVTADSYLTLHYRLATLEGDDIISTFHESPATLQMGTGQLAPQLEEALLGLEEGTHTTQELEPGRA